ncbi:ABC transporter ATP-binding protein [Clostridia bacterium]|nr:ABC transporter ATP-binding protein [Clostridia bacterium]
MRFTNKVKKYINKVKHFIILQVILRLFGTLCLASVPLLSKRLFDLPKEELKIELLPLIFILLGIYIAYCFLSYVEAICGWKVAINFEVNMKRDFLKAISRLRFKQFSQKNVGEYISLQANDITAIDSDYIIPFVDLINSLIMVVVYGTVLFVFLDFRIAIALILFSLFSVFMTKLTAKQLSQRRNGYSMQMGVYTSCIKDLLEGFKLINARTRENILVHHDKVLNETRNKRFYYGKFKALTLAFNGFLTYSISIAAFALAGYLMLTEKISVGTAVAALGYVECFVSPVLSILYDVNAIHSTKGIIKKVLALFETNADERDCLPIVSEFKSTITLDNVCLSFENFAMKKFSFQFEKGKKYAIIGGNGSGKSTILGVIMKWVDMESGSVFVDGEEIRTIDLTDIVFCANQLEHIYSEEFIRNMTVFGSYSPLKGIAFSEKIQGNYSNAVKTADNCQNLSGGEKQLLSVLRMLCADTPICLMDEPFAAVDEQLKAFLQGEIMKMKDKTVIMITHDLSESLSDFDEILIIENGELAIHGSFELISRTKQYRKLSEKQ